MFSVGVAGVGGRTTPAPGGATRRSTQGTRTLEGSRVDRPQPEVGRVQPTSREHEEPVPLDGLSVPTDDQDT